MKIPTDDLVLFGSLALAALGTALIAFTATGDGMLSVGVAFLVFGLPSAALTLMAGASK
jgi:hypothetical protein